MLPFSKSLAAVLILLAVSAAGCKGKTRPAEEGGAAPDFALRSAGGSSFRLSDNKGSVVVVNFWASWCEPCREEMPSLQRLNEALSGNPKFRLVSVLYRDDPQKASAFMRQNGFTYPMLLDADGSVSASYGLTGVPETFIVDKAGIVRKKLIGSARFDSPEAIGYIKKLIED